MNLLEAALQEEAIANLIVAARSLYEATIDHVAYEFSDCDSCRAMHAVEAALKELGVDV